MNINFSKLFSEYQSVISNTLYLSLVKVIQLAMPFIALPYIIKTIGSSNYGTVIFAQAVIAYFSIFINFGMDVSAVKDVSVYRNKKEELSTIVSSVLLSKFILLLIAFVVLSILILLIPSFYKIKYVLYFAFLSCLSEVLLPVWYYQGVEKMKYLTLIQGSSVVFYTITIFLFIKAESDYPFVALLQSLSLLFSGVVCLIMLFVKECIKFKVISIKKIFFTIKDSTPFFMSRVSFVLNTNMAKTISGLFLSMDVVASLDIAQKISAFVSQPIQMLNQAIFPFNAKNRDKGKVKKFFYIIAFIALTLSIILYFLAPYIVYYFTKGTLPLAVNLTKLLCIYIFFFCFSTYLGSPVLVAFSRPKPFNLSVIFSTIVMGLCYFLAYIFDLVNGYTMVGIMAITELFIVLYRYYYCKKFEIL